MANPAITEKALETGIVEDLLRLGYAQRLHSAFDKSLCLDAGPMIDFIQATQPNEWKKYVDYHRNDARDSFLKRVSEAVVSDGIISVLRNGVKATGCKFRLAFFKPETKLNPETEKLYRANQFTVMRQVRYSEKTDHSLDLAIFLNGLPIFSAELKNNLNGQTVKDAIRQYRTTRDPREPLFALGRMVAHFAVDVASVYMTTHLRENETAFLPFNQGSGEGANQGAGNPPPKLGSGFQTDYLWRETWKPDSLLDLLQYFVQDIRERDENGKLKRTIIFPRYHQLDSVRKLVINARGTGPGQNYLIQHSAGSGKSNSIAWLAHRLASLHDENNKRVFDSVIVVTDRIALDRQLSRTVSSFEQTAGLVEHIDEGGKHLKQALESGKQIIITTMQKFPVILQEVRKLREEWEKQNAGNNPSDQPDFYKLKGHTFALILDEAHSSQGGDAAKEMKSTLRVSEEDEEEQSPTDLALKDQKARGRMSHVSTFAFTATPKAETLELFGCPRPEGGFEPFCLYSMKQAIEEGFILDVVKNYIAYKTFWTLLKKIKEDPKYDRQKASKLLTRYVVEHPKTIREKVEVIVEHMSEKVLSQIGNRGRGMLVCSSRQQAVTYKLEIDRYLAEQGYTWRTIVAFSGKVPDPETKLEHTETSLNGFPDSKTAAKFETEPFRLLIVANKFQTGFDQPLLQTMYVDKKLSGVNAVQTLSRLNRTVPNLKDETFVLDFADNAERVQMAFSTYYGETTLADTTDPNELYTIEEALKRYGFYFDTDVAAFAKEFYTPRPVLEKIYATLTGVAQQVHSADEIDQREFRGYLNQYCQKYVFLGQIIKFEAPELEQLFQFSRYLLRLIPVPSEEQPKELQKYVDVQSVKLHKAAPQPISPVANAGTLKKPEAGKPGTPTEGEEESLSAILKILNDRFGTNFEPEDEQFIETLEQKLDADTGMAASFAVNTPENARLTFDHKVRDHVQDMIDTNFKFFKQINDKPEFANFLNDILFGRYSDRHSATPPDEAKA